MLSHLNAYRNAITDLRKAGYIAEEAINFDNAGYIYTLLRDSKYKGFVVTEKQNFKDAFSLNWTNVTNLNKLPLTRWRQQKVIPRAVDVLRELTEYKWGSYIWYDEFISTAKKYSLYASDTIIYGKKPYKNIMSILNEVWATVDEFEALDVIRELEDRLNFTDEIFRPLLLHYEVKKESFIQEIVDILTRNVIPAGLFVAVPYDRSLPIVLMGRERINEISKKQYQVY